MLSPSPARREANGIALCESFDNFADLRNGLKQVAADRGDWAGIPMPLEGHPLVVEPKYPNAEAIMKIGRPQPTDGADDEFDGLKLRNHFWSWRWRTDITIYEKDGKIIWGKVPRGNTLGLQLGTLGASFAWGIEQEGRAIQTLGTLLEHHTFKQYLLTGMFLETSKRSGVTYLFRKLRPTIAITTKGNQPRILAALCLHPIAYYEDSWAGAMCPTDDVLAHLMLMRGDEPMFWRRANQHAPFRPEAGI